MGDSPEAVDRHVQRLHDTGINAVIIEVKHGDGSISWPSETFARCVRPEAREFDFPAALLAACRRRGMQFHAWFIDFMEGAGGVAATEHPEWTARDRMGRPTTAEVLRGRPYGGAWMCPARRPGYTDQWLLPMLREFARRYDVDAIHHDYIRYPGDLAPDQYCFCDYCLREMPRFNSLVNDSWPDEPFYHHAYDREYLESHWEPGPRVLPANWDRLPRRFQSDFLLEGSFFQGGRHDLDYFFYTYRTYWITQFAREAAEAVRALRPAMRLSAAVFKNPVHSGRFIGQDWRQFAPWVDVLMPMDYRDHFPGTFDQYLGLLRDAVRRQKEWARDFADLWPGFAINFLYFEEDRPLKRTAALLRNGAAPGDILEAFQPVEARVRSLRPEVADAVQKWVAAAGRDGAMPEELDALRDRAAEALDGFRRNAPAAYWPDDKVSRVVATIRGAGAGGVCVFCQEQMESFGKWDAIGEALAADDR